MRSNRVINVDDSVTYKHTLKLANEVINNSKDNSYVRNDNMFGIRDIL